MISHILLLSAITILIYMTLGALVALVLGRNDIVDPLWGMGFVVVAWASWLYGGQMAGVVHLGVPVLVSLWGVRLSARLFRRFFSHEEDFRYAGWRRDWEEKGRLYFLLRSYGQVFLLQGLLMFVIALPLVIIQAYAGATNMVWAYAGLLLWCVGYFFEVVGDWQLEQFLKKRTDPNAIMQTGLWKYSRHPNYFGEICMWWGIWIIAMSLGGALVWAVVSPITITLLLRYVSGVPMLEKKWDSNPAYQAYKERTSMLIPLPPRQKVGAQESVHNLFS